MKSIQFFVSDWRVDPLTGEISSAKRTRHLEPKVMQVLVYLASNAGDVVTRDEILNSVWGSRGAVSDEPLTRCIKVLRHALDDSVSDPKYIRTIPKIGYELIASVEHVGENTEQPNSGAVHGTSAERSTEQPRWRQPLTGRNFAVIAGATIAIAVVLIFLPRPIDDLPSSEDWADRTSIAVLPFKSKGVAAAADYMGAGIAEEVRLLLGEIRELKVAAGQSSMVFANSGVDLKTIAQDHGIDYILDGTSQKEGTHTQVYVQLISGADGFQLWSEKYEFEASGIFETQTRIANSVVDALVETLALPNKVPRFDIRVPTESAKAYDLYLRGKQLLNLRTPSDLDAAIDMFEAAIEADPKYGMPYVAWAYAESLGPASLGATETRESFQQSRAILRTARDKDPSIVDAALGIEAFIDLREGRLMSAHSAYRRSLDRFPNEPILHHGYSLLMSTVGFHHEALKHAQIARDLDTQSPIANGRLAVSYLWAGENDKAEEYFNLSIDMGLDTVQNLQAYLLLLLRAEKFERARALGYRLEQVFGSDMLWWNTFVDAVANKMPRGSAIQVIEAEASFQQAAPIVKLGIRGILGNDDQALDTLDRMLQQNPTGIGGFLFAEELSSIRQIDRFGTILAASPIHSFWIEHGWPLQCNSDAQTGLACR